MSWNEWLADWSPEEVASDVSRYRTQGACEAMSRFLVFVWMEAQACLDVEENYRGPMRVDPCDARETAVCAALHMGLFRLDWGNK